MIVVIDNYDSFTYNLVQYLGELGAEPWVFRNDQATVAELASMRPSYIVISPGPGTPDKDAGISNRVIQHFHGQVPILGVCLGHQCIGHTFGGRIAHAPHLMHGKTSRIIHQGGRLFSGLSSPFEATRYHSLIVEDPLPEPLQALARTPEGEIMAMRHRDAPTFGVQFHPESILTGQGKRLLKNFLDMDREHHLDRMTTDEASPVEITLPQAIERALLADHLSTNEAEAVMQHIMAGEATPAQIGGYLTALRAKGETIAEITGFARAMRRHATAVRPSRRPLIDTCGTGGDHAGTFNISTTSALVVAGTGAAVAKHGNRSVSSRSGSADVLQALGVKLDIPPEAIARCIDEVGFGFLFASMLHPAMKYAIGPRREMGVRTIFNILGPLANPAGATMQIVGIFDRTLIEPLAHVLDDLGAEGAYVVSGADGLDELSITGRNYVACLRDGHVSRFELDPANYGLGPASLSAIRGGDATENAQITRSILAGERGPRRDTVLLNAGAALVAANIAQDLQEGIRRAAAAIDSGRAKQVLDNLVEFTQGVVAP